MFKIIHTLEFTINNFASDIYSLGEIYNRFKPLGQQKEKDKQFKLYTYGSGGAITYTYYDYFVLKDSRLTHIGNRNEIYSQNQDMMKMVVNVDKLLEKDIITPADYDLFKQRFTEQFTGLFPSHKYIEIENHEQIKLTRIDYKKDFYTEYKNLYIELLAKTSTKRHLKPYKNSDTYYISDSYNINLYNKLEERQAKNQSTDNIENLLRFEVQLKDRIDYNFTRYGVIPILKNYWSMADYNYYLNYCLHDIIYKGNYYNLYHAKIKINNSKKSKTVKKNLIEFITYISINGIAEAKKQFKSSFKNYIKYLNQIEVNPVLIAKNKSIQYKVTSLDNIFNFYNENKANTYLLDNYNVIKENYINIAV